MGYFHRLLINLLSNGQGSPVSNLHFCFILFNIWFCRIGRQVLCLIGSSDLSGIAWMVFLCLDVYVTRSWIEGNLRSNRLQGNVLFVMNNWIRLSGIIGSSTMDFYDLLLNFIDNRIQFFGVNVIIVVNTLFCCILSFRHLFIVLLWYFTFIQAILVGFLRIPKLIKYSFVGIIVSWISLQLFGYLFFCRRFSFGGLSLFFGFCFISRIFCGVLGSISSFIAGSICPGFIVIEFWIPDLCLGTIWGFYSYGRNFGSRNIQNLTWFFNFFLLFNLDFFVSLWFNSRIS